tara:strand:- start:75 stop:488 length:414 start_codon:yes stop_codon:yes gene_type:complete
MADMQITQQIANSIEPLRQLNRPPIMIPRMVSQAGTFMVLSYFMMKVMNMLKDRKGSVSKMQSGGIPQERAELLYFAHIICSLAGIVFIIISARASFKAQIGLVFLIITSLIEAMTQTNEEMIKTISAVGGLILALN